MRAAGTPRGVARSPADARDVPEARKIAEIDAGSRRCAARRRRSTATEPGHKTGWEYGHDLGNWSILRRIYSERILLETMTDFWSPSCTFPSAMTAPGSTASTTTHHPRARTRHVRGPAHRLLASPRHAGLPRQLDVGEEQAEREPGPRAAGAAHRRRDAGYTEAMVKASAVLLSGYTVDWGNTFEPVQLRGAHDRSCASPRLRHPNASADGQAATIAYLKYLANHPATARRIATKLATYFVWDSPSDGWSTPWPTSIRALGRHYGRAEGTCQAPGVPDLRGLKVRTPVADLVATARVLGVDVQAPTRRLLGFARQLHPRCRPAVLLAPARWPADHGAPGPPRRACSPVRHAPQPGRWLVPQRGVLPHRGVWLPVAALRFDAYVDHLCRTWLGRAADARLLRPPRRRDRRSGRITGRP